MVNCSKKKKAQCNGETCHWIVGKGCKRIRPVSEPVGCSRKRKALCMDSRHCHWVVGRGCKKNSHQPILPARRRRVLPWVVPPAIIGVLVAAELYRRDRQGPPRSPRNGNNSNGGGSSTPSIQMFPLPNHGSNNNTRRLIDLAGRNVNIPPSPPGSLARRSPSRSPPGSPVRRQPIRRVRSLPNLPRRPRLLSGHPVRVSPNSHPLTNVKKRKMTKNHLPWVLYPFARKNYYVN